MPETTTEPKPSTSERDSLFGFRDVMRHWWSFDARRGEQWMYLLVTLLYNSVLAVGLSIFFIAFNSRATWWNTFFETLLVSNCIGFSIHGLLELLFRVVLPKLGIRSQGWIRAAFASVTAMIGVYIGYSIAFALLGRNFTAILTQYPRAALGFLLIGFVACGIWLLIVDGQSRRIRAEAEEIRHAEERQRLALQAKGAELRALQAQIEPHFLFNTLANVLALIDYEPQTAKRMLDAFISHLRQSLDSSRQTAATLGSELDLLRTYLQLIEIRMQQRLRFEIDCPDELRTTPFAPLLLQPLVENAVKYGLEPKVEGGCVWIRARRIDNAIRIDVEDDGVGLSAKTTARSGTGTGIANVRERLQSIYGQRASLEVSERKAPATGTLSSITLKDMPSV